MADAETLGSGGTPRNRWLWIAGASGAAVIGLAALWWLVLAPGLASLKLTTGFAAKTVCSCVFVEDRSLESCRADLPAWAGKVGLRMNEARGEILASRFLVLARDLARFEPPNGCTLS